jgi:hypothetical protein
MNIPETLKMPSLSGLGNTPQSIFRNQSIRGFFGFKFSFQNCFWNVFNTSGLKKCLEASKSLLRKNIILEEKLSHRSKNGHKKFLFRKDSL